MVAASVSGGDYPHAPFCKVPQFCVHTIYVFTGPSWCLDWHDASAALKKSRSTLKRRYDFCTLLCGGDLLAHSGLH